MQTYSLTKSFKLLCFLLMVFLNNFTIAADIPAIAAASNVKFALNDIQKAFYLDTGKNIRISYSSSGNLTRQILQGGPFELFLSANKHYVEQLYQQQKSNQQLEVTGQVIKLLTDDHVGNRHQRFIIQVEGGLTLLVAHNIDLADRIETLKEGDFISAYGEYEWNERGGVIHWTHHDPQNRHVGGWIKHQGTTYQ